MIEKIGLLFLICCLTACTPSVENHFPLVETTIAEIQDAVIAGEISCHEVVTGFLERIESYDKPNGINAITVINPVALERADEVDRAIRNGEELPELFCTPLLVKDNFDTL